MTLRNFFLSFSLAFMLVVGAVFAVPHVFDFFNGNGSLEAEAYGDVWASPSNKVRPSCIDNYTTWAQQSYTPKTDNDWDLYFMPASRFTTNSALQPKVIDQFLDLNGDALPDYLYSFDEEGV